MPTTTISIGRNVTDDDGHTVAMPRTDWSTFQRLVRHLLVEVRAIVHVDGANHRGTWAAHTEESATWVAEVEDDELPHVEAQLDALAYRFGQDAIALTIGTTKLVGLRNVPFRAYEPVGA
jgi:hypothetical protein